MKRTPIPRPGGPRAARSTIPRLNPRDATLERLVDFALESGGLLPASGPILVGVSGGPDSVALLHCLARRRGAEGSAAAGGPGAHGPASAVEVVAAHVNHGLRGRESDADAEFVRGLAERWNLRYLEAAVAPRPGGSEEAARDARYDALGEMAIRCGADRVATAHTADDQAETVLLRLIRGAGLRGLAGMPARGSVRGVRVVRPLLGATREQVLDYLRRHGLPHRLDASNESAGPSRNFLRLEILPRIRSRLNPSAREAILRAAAAIRDAEGYLAAEARRVLPEVMRQEESGKISLDAARMLHYPKPLNTYLFRFAVQELNGNTRDLATAHIETLLSLVTTHRSRAVDLPGGARARREGGGIVLSRRSRTAPRKATSRG